MNYSGITSIYSLDKILEDPRLEGFALVSTSSVLGRDSFYDDLFPRFDVDQKESDSIQISLKPYWKSPLVEGRVAEFNDYPCLALSNPVFSERAVKSLSDLLVPNGEILPLTTSTKTGFYFYNILTISDALNLPECRLESWSDFPTTASDIQHFSFEPNKLQELSIFRLREIPSNIFVTDQFVSRVKSSKLEGFDFTKVWPLPPDTKWKQQPDPERKKRKALKQHTLVLIFELSEIPGEKEKIIGFEDQLDAKLRVQSMSSKYFGAYEGHDDLTEEYRMFLSCPDAEILLDHIRSDIQSLQWPSKIRVFRRYGGMHDQEAPEKISLI